MCWLRREPRGGGKGRGRLPSGVLTNLVCPEGHRQRGHSCGGRGSSRTCSWDGGGLVIFVAWTMPTRSPCSRSTGEHRAARARPAAGLRAACSSSGTMSEDRNPPLTHSWSLWLEQPRVPLWTPFKMSFLHPSPLDGCLWATPGWQNLRPGDREWMG